MLAKSKLDSIETLISQALIDIEISHEEFDTIIQERKIIWKGEWKFEEFKWNIGRKNWNYGTK